MTSSLEDIRRTLNELETGPQQHAEHLDDLISSLQDSIENTPGEATAPGKATFLRYMAKAYHLRFRAHGKDEDIAQALHCTANALAILPKDHPDVVDTLLCSAIILRTRFTSSGKKKHLKELQRISDTILELCPSGTPRRAAALDNSVQDYYAIFDLSDDPENIETVITLRQQILELYSTGDAERVESLEKLADSHMDLWNVQKQGKYLDEAIDLYQQVIKVATEGKSLMHTLSALATALMERYNSTADIADLQNALKARQQRLQNFPPGHPKRLANLHSYANALHMLADDTQDIPSFDRLMPIYQELLDALTKNDPSRQSVLVAYADALEARILGGADETVSQCISLREEALYATATGDHQYPSRLMQLADAIDLRPQDKGSARVIQLRVDALSFLDDSDRRRGALLVQIGASFEVSYDVTSNLEELKNAISYDEQALALTTTGDPCRLEYLTQLGCALYKRIDREGATAESSQRLITLHEEALHLCSPSASFRPILCGYLARAYQTAHDIFWKSEYVEKAIPLYREAAESSPAGSPEQALFMWHLSRTMAILYRLYRDRAVLDDAVEWNEKALRMYGDDASAHLPQRVRMMCDMAQALCLRFMDQGDRANVDVAIQTLEEALTLSQTDEDRLICLGNRGDALRCRYEILNDVRDLDSAVTMYEQALLVGEYGHPPWRNIMTALAKALRDRYERQDDSADIVHAIELQKAVLDTLPCSHIDFASFVSQLSEMLLSRYIQSGELPYLEEAAQLCRTHVDEPQLVRGMGCLQLLSAYCRVLRLSYAQVPDSRTQDDLAVAAQKMVDLQISGSKSDYSTSLLLDTAVSLSEVAAPLTEALPEHSDLYGGFSDRVLLLDNKANACYERFKSTHKLEDIDEAISIYRDSLTWIRSEGPSSTLCEVLPSMARLCRERYLQSKHPSDLDDAIRWAEEAVSSSPTESKRMPRMVWHAEYLINRHTLEDGERGELARAWNVLEMVVKSQHHARIDVRFHAALTWAIYAADARFPDSALSAFRLLFDLLPDLAWLGSDTLASLHAIRQARYLPVEAATYALRNSSVEEAIEFLEAGRTVVWTQATRLRQPVSEVEAVSPYLARRFNDLSTAIRAPRKNKLQVKPTPNQPLLSSLHEQWTETLAKIRQLSGLDHFLRPSSYSVLSQVAKDGPVVLLVDHEACCVAITISSPDVPPAYIPLTMTAKKLRSLHSTMQAEANSRSRDNTDEDGIESRAAGARRPKSKAAPTTDLLTVLWEEVARPVIEQLTEMTKPAMEKRRRIWWCTTGWFSWLPVHAAGLYQGKETISVSDFFVSSYTPTLNALAEARKRADSTSKKLLAAVYPHASPGFGALPMVKRELTEIVKAVPKEHLLSLSPAGEIDSEGVHTTPQNVLNALSEASILHLACHGDQDISNPLRSAFILRDGQRLAVEDIMGENTPHASLAFLSACYTASSDEERPDEAINLANAMLFAGFPSVIATMWPMGDAEGPDLARMVYSKLFDDRFTSGRLLAYASAASLDAATRELRKTLPWQRWAVFIHIGV